MTLHFIVGYAVAGLLVFRIIWGLVGPRHARFASLLHGPRTLFAYLREVPERRPSYWPGHNPLGGLFVILLLAVLVVQVVTGLIADPEDFVNVGPLADRVTTATSRAALNLHDILGSLLLPLVVLHVAVVFFYKAWKRENLIRPMITGFKRVRE